MGHERCRPLGQRSTTGELGQSQSLIRLVRGMIAAVPR